MTELTTQAEELQQENRRHREDAKAYVQKVQRERQAVATATVKENAEPTFEYSYNWHKVKQSDPVWRVWTTDEASGIIDFPILCTAHGSPKAETDKCNDYQWKGYGDTCAGVCCLNCKMGKCNEKS
jgi:hypothetical protein